MTDDTRIEMWLGNLLRAGVIVSASVVVAGAAWYLVRHGHEAPAYHTFKTIPENTDGMRAVLSGVAQAHSRSLIQLGLMLLIATPVARVVFSLFAFLHERDYLYVAITAIVLGVLMFSLFAGHTI